MDESRDGAPQSKHVATEHYCSAREVLRFRAVGALGQAPLQHFTQHDVYHFTLTLNYFLCTTSTSSAASNSRKTVAEEYRQIHSLAA